MKTVLAVLAVLFLCGTIGCAAYYYQFIKKTADQIYVPLKTQTEKPLTSTVEEHTPPPEADGSPEPGKKAQGLKPVSILLLGVDERENDRGRSDVIILATLHPQKESTLLFNIPRDTRTEIVQHGTVDKINHAYAFGGVDMAVNTVEKFLDTQIPYYLKVNMEGFEQIIDSLGGVEVDNELAFTYDEYQFPKGTIHLTGKMALIYSRMRSDDPRGDLGRNDRQQKVLKSLMAKSKTLTLPGKLDEVLKKLGSSVQTNLTFEEMKKLALEYTPAMHRIESIQVKGTSQYMKNIYYYIVSPQERSRIHSRLQQFTLAEEDLPKHVGR